ncbi:MAG: 2-amino-4-hydroxy-6-hydroxymethyldihydropteridine diphosphokinase [Minwuia sp.]|nr:2-amino-4-hydroxy-6-hydroxymethyldihydropteridine diphosphokinase [Minwuia sp.]
MILIGLGGNLPHPDYGPPENTLEAALERLSARGVHVAARSRWYVTPPFPPSISPQPWYVNGVARLETAEEPERLLQILHEIEWSFGRVRQERWAPRWIDLDLLAHGTRVLGATGIHGVPQLPHPRMADRAFVLLPLQEVAPYWRHPVSGQTAAEMLQTADASGVSLLEAEKEVAGAAASR